MKKRHFLLPLIPLAAIWAYVFTQSAGQFYDLMEATPQAAPLAAATAPVVRDAVPPTDTQVIADAERAAAAAYFILPAFEFEEAPVANHYSEPTYQYEDPYRYEDPYQYQYDEHQYDDGTSAEIPHPEITDPAMRKLLAPAWAD
jgi:hypothetical protein